MTRSPGTLVGYWNRQAPTYDRSTAGVERQFFADSRGWVCGRACGATVEISIGTGANLHHDRVFPCDVEDRVQLPAGMAHQEGSPGRGRHMDREPIQPL